MLSNRRVTKPPFGTPLDLSYPLTGGLRGFYALNENEGATCSDATGNLNLSTTGFGASNPWGSGASIGLSCPSSGMGAMATVPAALQWSGPITLAVGFRRLGTPTSFGNLCGLFPTNSNANPYRVAAILWSPTAGQVESYWCYNTSYEGPATSTRIVATDVNSVVSMTFVPGNPGAQLLYINGLLDSTFAQPQYPFWTSTAQFAIGAYPGYAANSDSLIYWAGWWSRALTAGEHAALAGNPWQIFKPRGVSTYFAIPNGPVSYLISGPTSGTVLVASGSFTVTPNQAVPSDTVSLSDNGAGGTFSPASLSWAASSTPQNFTYTPAVIGSVTITATDLHGYALNGFPRTFASLPVTLSVSGPHSGIVGATSGSFTVTPSAAITDIVTMSDGAGGTFSPASLSWAASSTPQNFTYTPAVIGSVTITATDLHGYALNGFPCTFASLPHPLSVSGPSYGTVGVTTASFTVTPSAAITDTVTMSDGAGGTFSPASLSWAASSASQNFTYTPGTIGANAVTLTSALGAVISGSPAPVSVAPAGSMHIASGNFALMGATSFAIAPASAWSASFFIRINAAPTSQVYNGFSMLAGTTNIYIEPGSIYLTLAQSVSYLFYNQPYALGQIFHIAFAMNATGTSSIYVNGVSVVSGVVGVSSISTPQTLGFAPYAGADLSVAGLSLWAGYTLTAGDAASLSAGQDPRGLTTPPIAYLPLAGTPNAAATVGDPGLNNLGTGGTGYSITSVNAHYSSDVLAVNQIVRIAEAFVSRTGALVFFRIASTFSRFYLSGDYAVYDRAVMSITVTAGGSGYTKPTATISGGNPATAAVLGPPVVVGGTIVGIPVWNGGDGYAASGVVVTISDPTGAGASCSAVIGGQPLPVTALAAQPTIEVNGSAATLNPQSFWSNGTNAFSWVAFQLQTPVTPGQSVRYSVPSGWASCSIGAAGASTNAIANNYAGALEPMFIPPSSYSLKMGLNHVADPMVSYASCSIGQDIGKRFSIGSAPMTSWWSSTIGIGSWVIGGNYDELPIPAGPTVVFVGGGGTGAIAACAISGGVIQSVSVANAGTGYTSTPTVAFTGGGGGGGAAAICTITGGGIASVTVTAGGAGYCDGIYTVQWDDTAPQGSGPYTPTTNIAISEASLGGLFLYVTPIASLSSAGTLVSGVLKGITKAYYVQYRPTSAYTYDAAIAMTFTGGSGTGPYTNTASDWIATPPGNVPNRANPVEPDQAIKALCQFTSTPTPTVPATIRYMDCTLPGGAVSNARHPADVTQLTDLSYNQYTQYLTASVAAIRPYNHSVSPNVYVEGPSPGAVYTANGSPTSYAIPAPSDGWINTSGNPSIILCEFVTSSPHGLGTYQEFSSSIPVPSYVSVTNGQIGTVQNPPVPCDIPDYTNILYSTGANTLIAQYGSFSQTSSATEPSGINNAAFTQGVTGGINNNGVGGVSIGSAGSGYTSGAAVAIAPPSGAWQTALATATTSGGSVSAINAVSGHAGNNYAIAPLVTIQPPTPYVAAATAACTVSGGAVQMPVLTYPGYGYTGNVAVSFWGGGGSGASATATVSGGKVTGFTGLSGGSGYTSPPLVVIAPPPSVASATATVSGGAVTGYTLTNAGSNYLTVTITGDGTGATAIAYTNSGWHSEASAGFGVAISGLAVTNGGSGYTHATATITGGGGSGATVTAVQITGGTVTGLTLGSGGSSYIPNYMGYPSVTVMQPAQEALVSAALSGGVVTGFNVIYGGSGYTAGPEVVVLGTGTGASGTAVLTGGVVSSVTLNAGGSGYTGTNSIAVSVAPPARQAIATVAVSNGALQQAYVVDPGCGYTNTPPAAAVVGSGSGAAATTTMIYPFNVYVGVKDGGCIPYEVAAGFTASLPGCGCWINIPPAATDALITSIIQSVASYLPAGQQIWVEYSNEHWNDGFPYGAMFSSLGNMTGVGKDAFYTGRAAAVHAVAESVLSGLGRGVDLVRVFGSWLVSGVGGVTDAIVAYANANNIRIDALAIGPYWDIPNDYPLQVAFANVIATNPNSITYGTTQGNTWPWTRAMAHDLLRHAIISDTRYLGAGTGGAPTGFLTSQIESLSAYTPVAGQTTRPVLVGYEASIERYAPYGLGNGGIDLTDPIERDLFYDPGMYDTMNAFFLMNQAGGVSILNFFQLQDEFDGGDVWALIMAEGQSPGRGDGSDGRANNLFWMEANTIPGAGSTAAAYTTYFDRFNVSPSLQAWRDWGASASNPAPPPTPTKRATAKRWFPGLGRPVSRRR